MLRVLLSLLVLAWGCAAEVTLDLPDPLIPGTAMDGTVKVSDPPSDIQALDLPAVAGLEWRMSGQNGSQTSNINGKQTAVVTIGLVLRAGQRGMLNLPPVTVRLADGSTLASAARTLRVDDGDARLSGDALAEAVFEPASIVPGQPTRLVYRIHLRRGEISTLGIAPPDGSITLGERQVAESRTFDAQGKPWTVVTITWPLTHAKPGTYTVRGQQDYQVVVGDGFFNQRAVRHQVAIPPATLTVEALPVEGRPADYSGLIGPLSAKAALDRERVSAGEGAVLSVTVSGRQTDLVKRPALHLAGMQAYPKDDQTAEGSRTFTWDLVPAAPGAVAIPALAFPYFDPASRSYRSAETAALSLNVIPGRTRDLGVVGQSAPSSAPAAAPAPPPPALPAPLRGAALPRPPVWAGGAALIAGLVIGLGLIVAQRLAGLRRGPHRGRTLRAAGRDAAALATALHTLRPALRTAEQLAAADALQAAIDRARFGGEALPDLESWLHVLEVVA